jgi:hypothetical protein
MHGVPILTSSKLIIPTVNLKGSSKNLSQLTDLYELSASFGVYELSSTKI